MDSSLADLEVMGNLIEAALWGTIAVVLLLFALKRTGTVRRRGLLAFVVFALFAASDVVESRTGAWWRPWWLFAWKAACVASMLGLLIDYERARHKSRD